MMEMDKKKSRYASLKDWFHGPFFLMYLNYFSVTWGYRMWYFALGLFFVVLGEMELLLTAIYGFLMGGSVLLFGGVIGSWVDRSNRMTAIRKSILIQKLSTALCAGLICIIFWFNKPISHIWNGVLSHLLNAVVIVLAIVAELAIMAYMRIQLQKDWFVVTANGNKSKLANLNAGARAVDQITNILAPIVTGQIMTSSSKIVAGIIIVVWHITAIMVEIFLVTKIYKMIPELSFKGYMVEKTNIAKQNNEMIKYDDPEMCNVLIKSNNKESSTKENDMQADQITKEKSKEAETENSKASKNCFPSKCAPLKAMMTGWRIYAKQSIVFAGLSLACLYMTVLGFDGITTGYIYSNGVPENVVGILNAIASLSGVIGAVLFTQLRKGVGLERTGLISYTWEIICLIFCVISLYIPGSRFQPEALWKDVSETNMYINTTICNENTTSNILIHELFDTTNNDTLTGLNVMISTSTVIPDGGIFVGRNHTECLDTTIPSYLSQSIIMFVAGICCSRLGLYITDLVIAQTIQENVAETERGIVSGIQNSLNHVMDMLKFTLVIVLPRIATFGYLVILAYIFLCVGSIFYVYHCFKMSKFSLRDCLYGRTVNDSQQPKESIKSS